MRNAVFFATIMLSLHVAAPSASACSGLECNNVLFPRAGFSVPENVPALFYFRGRSSGIGSYVVTLENASGTTDVVAQIDNDDSASIVIPFATPMRAGQTYTFRSDDTCWMAREQVIHVGAAAPLPTTLGALAQSAPMRALVGVPTDRGYCSDTVQAVTVNVDVVLSEVARAWEGMLLYEVLVDGHDYVGQSYAPFDLPPEGATHRGFGTVELAKICAPHNEGPDPTIQFDPAAGLAVGAHEVIFRARVAGTDAVLETAPVTVSLNCLDVYTQEEIDAAIREGGFGPAAAAESCAVSSVGARSRSSLFGWALALLGAAATLGVRARLAARQRPVRARR